jgi:hypothetical protein
MKFIFLPSQKEGEVVAAEKLPKVFFSRDIFEAEEYASKMGEGGLFLELSPDIKKCLEIDARVYLHRRMK